MALRWHRQQGGQHRGSSVHFSVYHQLPVYRCPVLCVVLRDLAYEFAFQGYSIEHVCLFHRVHHMERTGATGIQEHVSRHLAQ